MKETTLDPDANRPTPGDSPRRLKFEWTGFEYSGDLYDNGEPEVIDVTRVHSAEIIEPEPGNVVESSVWLWGEYHKGHLYAILSKQGVYSAIRTDVKVDRDRDWRQRYQMRPVVLDEPNRPRAWEVLRRNPNGHWDPVEGQHLRARTALAEDWLAEIGPLLAHLSTEQRRLLADRRALGGGASSFREPPVPVAEQAGSPAPPAGPGDRDLLLRDLARLAELQVERARQSLAAHRLVGEGIARWNLPRLAGHWLRSLPLHRQFQREVATHLRIRGELDRCVRLAPPPDSREPMSPRSEPPPNDAAAKLDQELKAVSDKLLQAGALVRHLHGQRGSRVTLLQTKIVDRRDEILPTLPPDLRMAPRATSGPRMRI